MQQYTIYVGADHRGFEKKNQLMQLLQNCHPGMVQVEDVGAFELDPEDDFNDPALAVAQKVAGNDHAFGVLICGSAHGVCMQANRIKGIRAINATNIESVKAGRADDYANVLCMSGDELSADEMERLVKTLCHTHPKTDAKYLRRVERLDNEIGV